MLDTWKSKKLWFSVAALIVLFTFPLVAGLWVPAMLALYDTFVGGVVAITGLLLAGNIANKLAVGKAQKPDAVPLDISK